MSAPGALSVQGFGEWVQLVFGLLLFLAPGLAAADRLMGLRGRGWWFAPVFSFTLLPLGAILLDLVLQVRITLGVTVGLAVAWTVLLEMPRLRRLRMPKRADWDEPRAQVRVPKWTSLAFLLVLAFVFFIHSLPHLPGDEANVFTAYPELGARALQAVEGEDFPYPIHVDEHFHLSQQAAIERQGTIDIDDPYTGEPAPNPLFSISGFRQERGFNLVMVQLHELTGMDLTTQARFVPAFQTVLLAALVHATLAPAVGSRTSALFVAIIPTTVRFLGPAFMVPSAFALPWIVTALHISLRGRGAQRLAALAVVETGAFFMHLVPGVLTLAVAGLATLARADRGRDKLLLFAVCFLPLVWVGPLVFQDAVDAVSNEHELGFQPGILYKAGLPMLLAGLAGAILAYLPSRRETAPHRVLAVLACAILVSMGLSITSDHHNEATYARLMPTFFLCLAALAGLAVGVGMHALALYARRRDLGYPFAALAALLLLAPSVDFHLDTPYYRVFDEPSWRDGRILAATNITTDDVFLSDPWRAQVYNALTGALPATVLINGVGPTNSDWNHYLASGGADASWLAQRGITYVVAPVPPNAPHERVGGNVYYVHHGGSA